MVSLFHGTDCCSVTKELMPAALASRLSRHYPGACGGDTVLLETAVSRCPVRAIC